MRCCRFFVCIVVCPSVLLDVGGCHVWWLLVCVIVCHFVVVVVGGYGRCVLRCVVVWVVFGVGVCCG